MRILCPLGMQTLETLIEGRHLSFHRKCPDKEEEMVMVVLITVTNPTCRIF